MKDMKEARNILSEDRNLRCLFSLHKREDNWLKWQEKTLPKLLKPKPRRTKNENKKIYKEKGHRH